MGGSLGKSSASNNAASNFNSNNLSNTQNNAGTFDNGSSNTGSFGGSKGNAGSITNGYGTAGSITNGYGTAGTNNNNTNKSSGSTNQNVWSPQGSGLNSMYNSAGSLADKSGANAAGQMNNGANFTNNAMGASVDPWQDQMQGGAYKDLGVGNQLMDSLNQSMNSPSASQEINNMIMGGSGNNYADAMKNQYVNDANKATDNMLSNLDARAAASGMSGGSRHGIATAQGMDDINSNLQSNMAQTGFNTFDQDLNRKLEIAGQADQGTLARQQMMSDMLGQQQNTSNTGINNTTGMAGLGNDQQQTPWNQLGNYSSVMGGPTVLDSGQNNSKGSDTGNSFNNTGNSGSTFNNTGNSGSTFNNTNSTNGAFGNTLNNSGSYDTGKSSTKGNANGGSNSGGDSKGFELSGGQ